MSDKFSNFSRSLTSPPFAGFAVSPSDSADLPTATRALNVGTTGTVRVTLLDGSEVTLTVGSGVLFPVRVTRIWSTGTTADGIVGLY